MNKCICENFGGGHGGGGGRFGPGGRDGHNWPVNNWGYINGNGWAGYLGPWYSPYYYYDPCTPLGYSPEDTGYECCASLQRCNKDWNNDKHIYSKCINLISVKILNSNKV